MIIGSGEHRYEVEHDWAKLPEGKALSYTHGIVQDRQGRIIIANMSDDAIAFFDAEGNFIKSFGEKYASGAHGLTIAEEGGTEYLYLANTYQGEVVKTDLDGKEIWVLREPPRPDLYDGDEKKFVPTEVAVGPNGMIYVADGYGQHWVHIYTTEGGYVSSFGGTGSGKGELDQPHGIGIDARGAVPLVQVANRANARIDNFTLDGQFVGTAVGPDLLRRPCSVVHWKNELYVPELYCRVSVFDGNNQLICYLGDYVDGVTDLKREDLFSDPPRWDALRGFPNIEPESIVEGKFSSPHDLHVDAEGNIYVVEWMARGRVTKLTRLS